MRSGQRRLHRLTLDDHLPEVCANAATAEPVVAPHQDTERVDLAEMRRTLDWRAGQAQCCGLAFAVQAQVAVVDLLGQHLRRIPVWAVYNDVGTELHGVPPAAPGPALRYG